MEKSSDAFNGVVFGKCGENYNTKIREEKVFTITTWSEAATDESRWPRKVEVPRNRHLQRARARDDEVGKSSRPMVGRKGQALEQMWIPKNLRD